MIVNFNNSNKCSNERSYKEIKICISVWFYKQYKMYIELNEKFTKHEGQSFLDDKIKCLTYSDSFGFEISVKKDLK